MKTNEDIFFIILAIFTHYNKKMTKSKFENQVKIYRLKAT